MHHPDPLTDGEPIADLLNRLDDAESRLADLAREVEHLQRLATIGTLAAGIVHEINNQLTPALAQAQIARLNTGDQKRLLGAVDQCIRGITQASRIADSLLGYALPAGSTRQGGDGRGAASGGGPGATNVAQAVKAALSCLGVSRERAAVRIETDLPLNAWVSIEPLALQQVLINLLLNSIKALAETRDPVIRIAAQCIDRHQIAITVEDNGPGIPEGMRPRLFTPFATAPSARRSAKGTGLGLTISRRLIDEAGGSIQAGESQWRGARFTIQLASISAASNAKSA